MNIVALARIQHWVETNVTALLEPRILSATSSNIATLHYGTCRGHQFEQMVQKSIILIITDLPDDGHKLVDLSGLAAHQFPAAGFKGRGVPHQQHVVSRLLSLSAIPNPYN